MASLEKTNAYRILVQMPEGKKLLWRHRYTLGNNLKINLTEIGWGSTGRIHLALLNTVLNLQVHKMLENSWVAELVAPQELSFRELISISKPLLFYLGRPDRMHSRNASFYIPSKDAFSHCTHRSYEDHYLTSSTLVLIHNHYRTVCLRIFNARLQLWSQVYKHNFYEMSPFSINMSNYKLGYYMSQLFDIIASRLIIIWECLDALNEGLNMCARHSKSIKHIYGKSIWNIMYLRCQDLWLK
jgi:hypothetical protein